MKLIPHLLILISLQAPAADPSLQPLPDPTGKKKHVERSRILTDLDGDGVDDLLLSGGPETFGSMGGPWTVHFSRKGEYVQIGEIVAHPLAIAIEPDQARHQKDLKLRRHARIWVYLKSSGSAGSYGYYRVGEDSVDEMQSIEIHPGDGGTALGNAIYNATFKNSPIPFTVQRSKTAEDGKVTWSDSER
jgi:hypothetical protein